MDLRLLRLAGINGFLAVALGAFGAHGLKGYLEGMADAAERLAWWETAAHYHLAHALALAAAAYLAQRGSNDAGALRWARLSGWAFQIGILLFSGSLYTMTMTSYRFLGAVTPLGGLLLLLGWFGIARGAGLASKGDSLPTE